MGQFMAACSQDLLNCWTSQKTALLVLLAAFPAFFQSQMRTTINKKLKIGGILLESVLVITTDCTIIYNK